MFTDNMPVQYSFENRNWIRWKLARGKEYDPHPKALPINNLKVTTP